MILCVTPNPAIDRTLTLSALTPGTVLRPRQARAAAGGKGVNVARAVQTLGGTAICAGPVSGHNGRWLDTLARKEGLQTAWTWTEDETRTCLILIDESTGQVVMVYEPGPTRSAADWIALGADLRGALPGASAIAVSGSLPPGIQTADQVRLLQALAASGRPVWVDSNGPGLVAASQVAGLHLKLNAEEAGELLGLPSATLSGALAAGRALRARGASTVVLTRGDQGALAFSGDLELEQPPIPVRAHNPTGSGDSFLAGLLLGLEHDLPLAQALTWAAAAGAANAAGAGGASFTHTEWESLLRAAAQARTLGDVG